MKKLIFKEQAETQSTAKIVVHVELSTGGSIFDASGGPEPGFPRIPIPVLQGQISNRESCYSGAIGSN